MQLGALEGDVDTGDPPPPFDLAAGGGKGHLPALSTHAVLIDSAAASDLKWLSFISLLKDSELSLIHI